MSLIDALKALLWRTAAHVPHDVPYDVPRSRIEFCTIPLGDDALAELLEAAEHVFLLGGVGFGGGGDRHWCGEIVLARDADDAAERARLVAWLRARPEVVSAAEARDTENR